jgi:hypothetical protein
VPGRFPLFREAALALFLVAVALGLWLAELRPLAVVGMMALALAVAWVIEWFSWREDQIRAAAPPPGVAPAEAVEETVAVPVAPPRARGLWLLRGDRAARGARQPAETPSPTEAPAPAEPVESGGPGHAPPAAEPPPPREEAEPAAPEPAAPEPAPPAAEEPPPSRRRLQPVRSAAPPAPPPAPQAPAAPTEVQGAPVVPLWARSSQAREWNLWDLERIARAQTRRDPERFEEWSYLFLHLRRFANADGVLPAEFDGLVRDYFGGLLEPAQGA